VVCSGGAKPSDAGTDEQADGDGGENGESSENEGPRFGGRAASGPRVGGDEIVRRDELGRDALGPDGCPGGLSPTEFDGGVANAGALFGETLEQFLVGVGEGGGRVRKDFEDSGELSVGAVSVEDRNDEDGADAEVSGDGGVDAGVELGIDGKLRLMGLNTGAGETVANVKGDAEVWSEVSGGGAADHFIATRQGQGGSAGAGGFRGADYQFVKNQIQGKVRGKTGEDVLFEEAGQIQMRIVRAELGPRHRLREHILVPAACGHVGERKL